MHPSQPKGAPSPVRYKVLLVDDEATVLKSLAAALELELDIATSSSAEHALTMLKGGDFHVVCTDYAMTGMSGIELLEKVSHLPEPIGCLLVTGSTSYESRNGASASDHYVLMKPVDPQRILALILQLARTAEMKRGAQRVKAAAPR